MTAGRYSKEYEDIEADTPDEAREKAEAAFWARHPGYRYDDLPDEDE